MKDAGAKISRGNRFEVSFESQSPRSGTYRPHHRSVEAVLYCRAEGEEAWIIGMIEGFEPRSGAQYRQGAVEPIQHGAIDAELPLASCDQMGDVPFASKPQRGRDAPECGAEPKRGRPLGVRVKSGKHFGVGGQTPSLMDEAAASSIRASQPQRNESSPEGPKRSGGGRQALTSRGAEATRSTDPTLVRFPSFRL